jgi:ankyrin repeat protein
VSGSSAEIVRDLLEHGANVNATQHNTTPLISAIWYNRHTHSKHEACHEPACHIERMLVAAGGRLGAGLPLHDAAHFGSVRVVQALLSNGADVHAMDAAGWTPLHMAAAHGRAGIIRALVAAGADVHVEDGEGKTPKARARLCSQTTLWGASVAWYADAIAELVAAGDTD